jgi:hypothetical protein
MSNLLDAISELEGYLDTGPIIEQVLGGTDADDDDRRVLALCDHLNCCPDDIDECRHSAYGMTTYSNGTREYAVATDSEADDAQDAALDSYLEDGIVEGCDGPYFDTEMWKRDAKMDGRGHCLAGYDGNEEESYEFFIYRVN